MSFINNGTKPKLVENKVVEKIIKVQYDNKPLKLRIFTILWDFLLNNLFVISIFTFIGLLLIYRYIDVQSRKKKETKETKKEETPIEEVTDS